MRSSRALQLLQYGTRPLHAYTLGQAIRPSIRNGYCSSCNENPAPGIATSTSNPPIPPADHRQLAIDQELFTTSIYSPGSPLFLPNGTRIFNKLTAFLRAQYEHFGFQEVITPTIYKKSLWEKSGHWENYAEDMFSVTGRGASGSTDGKQLGEDEEFGLKPMNCPGHCILFASKARGFREMPVRYSDFSPLHRNEISGALSGLTRVRRFHQDDGHIFCRPSQVGEEISKTLDFVKFAYETFKLGPYRLALSTRPKENYIGTQDEWENAEAALRSALDTSGQEWSINEGDGAFYGPKIDIILKDSDGKEHQTATVQLDFQLPKRFELEYTAPAPELEQKGLKTTDPELLAISGPVRPVMIHRAVLGSVERFMALLIEHYNGHWPFWLNPRQVMIITVSDEKSIVDYALNAKKEIQGGAVNERSRARSSHLPSFAVDIDATPRPVRKKISEAKRKRYSVIIVVGKKDVEAGTSVTVDFSAVAASYESLGDEVAGSIDRASRLSTGSMPESIDRTADQEVLTVKTPVDVRAVRIEPSRLRELLLKMEHVYA